MAVQASEFDLEKAVYLEAIEIVDPAARARLLDERCGKDTQLRNNVEALLACDCDDGFLQAAANVPLVRQARESVSKGRGNTALELGELVDERFLLVESLGEGGCGSVFRAEQLTPIRRDVALKVVKLGMDTQSVVTRFEAEKQALALMDHPGIARVYDGGTTESGRPYFAMELVRGVRITEFSTRRSLSLSDRLSLFIDVCLAIQHAHQKGVIHRDIKPSNILVTCDDDRPQAKVIDFGIAKALDQTLTDHPNATAIHLFIGTPAYTSPEQASMRGENVDTRSDVYSLGILLYELVAGMPPFDPNRFSKTTLDEMRQIICEEVPAVPSVAAVSEVVQRDTLPQALQISADLDWITMKCLEKDPARRYATVAELAKDLSRHLEGEPVLAHPPSKLYRFQRFVFRNRAIVAMAAAFVLTLIVATGVSTWMAVRAIRAEREQSHLLDLAESRRLEARREAYVSDMNLVRVALAANNRGRASELLQRHVPALDTSLERATLDLRHWEWRYFRHQTESAAAFELPWHAHRIRSVKFGRSDDFVGSLDERNEFRLWDLRSGASAVSMTRLGVRDFAFSPDGQVLATVESGAERMGVIHLWDVKTGHARRQFQLESSPRVVHFNQDGSELLFIDSRTYLHRWQWRSDTLSSVPLGVERPRGFRRGDSPIVFSNRGNLVAYGGRGVVGIYDVATGEIKATIRTPIRSIAALAFSPDERQIAVGPSFLESDSAVRVFDIESAAQTEALEGHTSWVSGITFTADGRGLITSAADQTIRIWDLMDKTSTRVLRGHASEVNCVGISTSESLLISGGKDGSLLVWETERASNSPPYQMLPGRVRDVVFLGKEAFFLSLDEGGSVSAWDPETLLPIIDSPLLDLLGDSYDELIASPDGRHLAAKTEDGRVTLLDLKLEETQEMQSEERFRLIGFHGLQGDLLVMSFRGRISLLNRRSLQPYPLPVSTSRWHSVISPTQPMIAYSKIDGEICLNDWRTGSVSVLPKEDDWGVGGFGFSSDGMRLAAGMIDGSIRLWDVHGETLIATIRGHLLGVHAVAFSPDGKRLATSSSKHEAVKLWDLETFREVATLPGKGVAFGRVRFSPDGVLLIAINRRGKAHVWRAPDAPVRSEHTQRKPANQDPLVAVSGREDSLLRKSLPSHW